MRKYFLGMLAIALWFGAMALVRSTNRQDAFVDENQGAAEATDGAFRDGLYQGQRAIARGSGPHVAIGRWARAQDRVSFAAGYRKGYTDPLSANDDATLATNVAFPGWIVPGNPRSKTRR